MGTAGSQEGASLGPSVSGEAGPDVRSGRAWAGQLPRWAGDLRQVTQGKG